MRYSASGLLLTVSTMLSAIVVYSVHKMQIEERRRMRHNTTVDTNELYDQ